MGFIKKAIVSADNAEVVKPEDVPEAQKSPKK